MTQAEKKFSNSPKSDQVPTDTLRPVRITRLTLGIIGIVLSALVLFQSCMVYGLSASISEMDSAGAGAWGMIIALLFLAGSITQVASRKSRRKAPFIATCILFGIAAISGFIFSGYFSDLMIWGSICLIYAIVELVLIIVVTKKHL